MLAIVALFGVVAGTFIGWHVASRRLRGSLLDIAAQVEISPDRSTEVTLERLGQWVEETASTVESTRSERRRFRHALDAVTQGVVLVDDEGVVSFANEFARTFLGSRHGEALVESAIGEIASLARRDGSARREVELFGPPERALVVSATKLGEGARVVVLIDDVSDFRRLDAVRSDFVANVSHEMKTPVAAIGLLAETMEGESDPDTLRQLAGRANREAFRVGRIIDDLLDLSRLEVASMLDAENAVVDVADVIAEAVALVADLADSSGVEIAVAPTDVAAALDRVQMRSAIRNLVENAVRYSGDASTVDVRVAHRADDLSIAVEDHGIGVPNQDLDRIFERFYRVDRGRSRATGGTGLGLAIVELVATSHGGTVEVVSREGSGSTFTMMLPGVVVDVAAEESR